MLNDHYDSLETRSQNEREESNLQLFKRQLKEVKQTSSYWSKVLSACDEEALSSLNELDSIPILYKSGLIELQEETPPYGGLVNDASNVQRIFFSPGPIVEPQPSNSADPWQMARALYAAGFVKEDIVANCFSYHLTPAGIMFDEAITSIGATVFPAGVGNVDTLVQAFQHLKVNSFVGTPDFLKIIIEKAESVGVDLSGIEKALVTGGPLFPEVKEFYQKKGISVCQCYGTAELGLIAYEAKDDAEGLIVSENCFVEIVRPGTTKPLHDGEVGEVVVTTLNRGYPLIRFSTGDLSAFIPNVNSTNGRTNKRLKGWMGRADQATKVRGMFVHPKQVAKVTDKFPEIFKARIEVSVSDGRDEFKFLCESSDHSQLFSSKVEEAVRAECRLRSEVIFVETKSLPNDGKVIDDKRVAGY